MNGHVETRTRHPRAVIPKAAEERRHRADSALTAVASRRTGVAPKPPFNCEPKWASPLRADPYSGAAFVFRSKRGDYVKILAWDGSSLCLSPSDLRKVGSSGPRSWRARSI